jgi:hypothetical protein
MARSRAFPGVLEKNPGGMPSTPLLNAAVDFAAEAGEVLDEIAEASRVPPSQRVKAFGSLIELRRKTFDKHGVTGAAFMAAQERGGPDDDLKKGLELLDAVEGRWSELLEDIERESAECEHTAVPLQKDAMVTDFSLPTAAGTTWRLSAHRGKNILLVVNRHFG